MARPSLSELLNGNSIADTLQGDWDNTEAAGEFSPIPKGTYQAHIARGELFTSKNKGTPGYKLVFKICEGEHTGRMIWHDLYLTAAALPMTKRDLGKLGITSLQQLGQVLPPGIRCKVKVTQRNDDDGTEYNRVQSFEVVGIDTPTADPFAPGQEQGEVTAEEPLPVTPGDTSFNVAELESTKPF